MKHRMFSLTVVLVLLASSSGDRGDDVKLDQAINEVFKRPTPTVYDTPSTPSSMAEEDGDCVCVPYYLCNNGTINTNGDGLIDVKINDNPCPNIIHVCCNKDKTVDEPIVPTLPLPDRSTPSTDRELPQGCGFHHPEGVGFRITGDQDNQAQFGEFPWMVAILKEKIVAGQEQKLEIYQCGGALIHPSVVLTAAHCVTAQAAFTIRAGEWDTQTKDELYPYQDRKVSDVVRHPKYHAGTLFNDVALLFLSSPVTLAPNVAPICLPPQNQVPGDVRCFATGWGKDVFGQKGKYSVIMKKVDLPVVRHDACQESLRKTRLGRFFNLHETFICAGGEANKDTCKGDGGSPLVCPISGSDNRYYQAGIVAWGIGCGENQTPGVYANVAKFRQWIDGEMRKHNFDSSSYQE